MKKILAFFTFSGRPSPGHGHPLVLLGTICILLLSLLLFSLIPPEARTMAPALQILLNQLPLSLFCPAFMILCLRLLNRNLPLSVLLDFPPFSRSRIQAVCRRNLRILLLIFPLIQIMILISVQMLQLLGYSHLPQQQLFLTEHINSWSYCLILLLCTVILAPVGEELLFRLLLCTALTRRLPPPLPQLLTSAAFAIFHGIPQAVPSLFLLAVILQKRQEEDGLPAAILLHSSYNLLIFLILLIKLRFLPDAL